MMGMRIALALLVICLGASALGAEARAHEKFSASTYYDSSDTVADVIPPKDENTTTTVTEPTTTSDPNDRYPHGHYPDQTHVWNATTEKYETVTDTDPGAEGRYPHGHYPGQTHVWNATTEKYETVTDTDPGAEGRYPHGHYPGQTHVWNATTEKYETVTDTDPGAEGRYPHGHYPGQTHVWNATTEKYETVGGTDPSTNGNPSEGRYEHGYYGKATFNYTEGDTLDVIKSTESSYTENSKSKETTTFEGTQNRYAAGYYNGHSANPTKSQHYSTVSQTVPDPETYDPDQGRYPHGYYGTNAPKSTSSKTGVRFTAQDPTTDMPGERYPYGYYGQNAPKTTSVKPVTYSSYTGNFETLPYPSSGVPYVPNGDGCRTAYWAEHTTSWPAFLKVTATIGEVFGAKATEVYGQTTVLEALLNYGSDPFSALSRSGCTSLLNSYTRGRFAISPIKVIEDFIAALVSKEAATKQALAFETANVESISAGNACT